MPDLMITPNIEKENPSIEINSNFIIAEVTFHGVGKIGHDNQGLYRAPHSAVDSDLRV